MNLAHAPRPVKSVVAEQGNPLGIKENFGNNLRRLCKERDLEQRQLAELMGVAESLVSRWVHAKHLPRPNQWDQLVTIFKCDYADFVADVGAPPSPRFDDLIERFADRAGYELVKRKKR